MREQLKLTSVTDTLNVFSGMGLETLEEHL